MACKNAGSRFLNKAEGRLSKVDVQTLRPRGNHRQSFYLSLYRFTCALHTKKTHHRHREVIYLLTCTTIIEIRQQTNDKVRLKSKYLRAVTAFRTRCGVAVSSRLLEGVSHKSHHKKSFVMNNVVVK